MDFKEKDYMMLQTHFLFSGVSIELLKAATSDRRAWVSSCQADEVLHSPQTEEQIAGLLLSGKAVVSTPDPAKKTLMRFLHAGDIFGVANLFSKVPYISLVTAEKPCRVAYFTEECIHFLLNESETFRDHYIAFLNGRIRYLNRKIGYLTAGCAERRLALYLVSLGEGTVQLKDSISSLSELLNLGRASLYRAFDKLCEDGYLIKNGRSLTVTDAEGMLNAYCS